MVRGEASKNRSSGRDDSKLAKRLEDVIRANKDYQFTQQNGQRVYQPCPSANCFPPARGCEIFIGNIPKHIFEDELIPLFQKIGKIYKFRLMLDFNQRTRGYGFATYFKPQHVIEAIDKLNGYEIVRGVTLGVYKSIDNCRLFVGNIPRSKTSKEVLNIFENYVEGVINVLMYPSWQNREQNRGFAFVEFESHIQASIARRQLHPRNMVVWDQALYVDWADPVPEVNPRVLAKVSVLYIKNLPFEWENARLHLALQSLVNAPLINKIHKIHNYAFVHCKNRRCAELVMEKLNGTLLEGEEIEVDWARPRQYSSQRRASQLPDNYCLSVPLRTRRLIRQMTESRRSSTRGTSESDGKLPSINSDSSESEQRI